MTAAPEFVVTLPTRHRAQAQIVAEAKRFNVLQCGRRFGKTTLGEDLALDPALDGEPVGWFAPTYKLLDEPWRHLLRLTAGLPRTVDRQQHRISFPWGGSIDFWTMDKDDPGRSYKYARVIIDEAGIVKNLEAVWTEAIRATLTDLKGDAWFLGTPKGRNYFHQLFVKGQTGEPGWKSWRFATVDNPFIDPAEVEDAEQGLPEAAFKQEFLGEPADDAGNPFGLDAIRDCIAPLSSRPVVAWGWDLARAVDWTAGVGLDAEGRTAAFERFQHPWEPTIRQIRDATGQVPALVDSTGVGDAVVEALQKGSAGNYEGFKFSSQSKQQLMEGLAVAIQRRAVRFPAGPIVHELEAFQYEYTRTGVRYEGPPGTHDDCVMALALAVQRHGHLRVPRDISNYPTIQRH